MNLLSTDQFAAARAITRQAASRVFREASQGKPWRGHHLPVVPLDGHRGGAGGKAWGLVLDAVSPDLRAELNLPETPPSTLPSTGAERRLKCRPDDRHFGLSLDRQRIIAPILATKRGSAERAETFRAVAARPHRFGAGWQQFSERTLRDWVKAHEERGPAALVPAARRDRGKPRVRLAREWHRNCGLPEDVQDRIADQIERTARGLIVKRRSDREVGRLCSNELARLTAEAGVNLPRKRLEKLCRLSLQATRKGYLSPAMQDWAVALCRSDEASFDAFLQKAVPAFAHITAESHLRGQPPAQGKAAPASAEAAAICVQLGIEPSALSD